MRSPERRRRRRQGSVQAHSYSTVPYNQRVYIPVTMGRKEPHRLSDIQLVRVCNVKSKGKTVVVGALVILIRQCLFSSLNLFGSL